MVIYDIVCSIEKLDCEEVKYSENLTGIIGSEGI
jgi:hypothetical protein